MISQQTIDAIFNAVRIEEVVDDFVKLTKRGVNYKGLCPFHDEKTPSFTVSPTRNIYKCFGCGRGGNSVNFVMEHETMTYPEALRYLAKKYQIEIEESGVPEDYEESKLERESLFLINQFALEFYQKQLFDTDIGKSVGLSYFRERGLLRRTIDDFGLGYAPGSRDALTEAAVKAGYKIDFLRKLGLTTDKDRDFFFNRVIFPIHNLTGKVVAFAGRQLSNNKKSPKYINSKESDIYHKSNFLYGAHLAKGPIRKEDHCILVEGYTDVLALHQSGIKNVVASSGTALTVEQIKLVKRYTQQIKLLYDGDAAGIKAALRGVDLVLAQDMNVELVLLPEGEDPDSYLNKVGASAFREYLNKEAKDFILFKTDLILEEAGDDPVKKANLIKDIVDSLAHIPDPIKRAVYVRQCSSLLSIDESILIAEVNRALNKQSRDQRINKIREAQHDYDVRKQLLENEARLQKADGTPSKKKVANDHYQEKDILRLLIVFGDRLKEEDPPVTVGEYILSNIQEVINEFENETYAKIVMEYGQRLSQKLPVDTEYFINHSDKEISEIAVELSFPEHEYSENWQKMWGIILQTQPMPEENVIQDSIQALWRFMLRKYQRLIEKNNENIKKSQAEEGKETELMTYLRTHQLLVEQRNLLAEKLNSVVL